MEESCYHSILKNEGFERIGSLNCDFQITLWWHQQLHLQLELVKLYGWVLLRATKHYRLTAMGKDGELYVRDLAEFDSYLTTHFGEVHIYLSSVRGLTPNLIHKRIREIAPRYLGDTILAPEQTTQHLEKLSNEILTAQDSIHQAQRLLKLDGGRSALLQRAVQGRIVKNRSQLEQLQAEKKTLNQQSAVQKHLENEYTRKGEATCLLFTCCSNIQIASGNSDFADALYSVVKELQDIHKYQIRQKLQGSKLHIYVEEMDTPGISLLTRWAGAAMNPRQLSRLGSEFADLTRMVEDQFMVFARKDIFMGGSIQDEKKLVGTRVVRNFLKKLEVVPAASNTSVQSPKSSMPIWIGNIIDQTQNLGGPWELPLEKIGHTYLSGRTGSGKSYFARVIVEGAMIYRDLSVVILDPQNQWAGLLLPENRPEIFKRYKSFGLKPEQSRSFDFTYYGLAHGIGKPLPSDLRKIAYGHHIISFLDLDDLHKYTHSADVLEGILNARRRSESKRVGIIIAIEEVPDFMKKYASKELRDVAERFELIVDRITREGRKYGISLLIISQTIGDFSRNVAIVRQNISTRVFMQNSDREVEHASQFLDDAKEITKLRRGEAFVCNPEWGTVKVSIRPPFSLVWQLSDEKTRKLVGSVSENQPTLSKEAQAVFDIAYEQYSQTGKPAKLTSIVQELGITSRRKIGHIVDELKKAFVAKFERLDEQGKPLVIIPISVHKARINRTETWTKARTRGEA